MKYKCNFFEFSRRDPKNKMRHSTENVNTIQGAKTVGFKSIPREVSSPEDDGYGSKPSSVVSEDCSRTISLHLDKSKNS